MIRLLMLLVLVTINISALSFFLYVLHRMFASGPGDFGGASALLGAVIGVLPIFESARRLTDKIHIKGWQSLRSHTGVLLGLNLAAIVCVLSMWYFGLPAYSRHMYSNGLASHEKGKLNEAIIYFERSVYQQPDNPPALLALATIYEDIDDDETAIQYYRLTIKSEAAPYSALNNLSRLHIKKEENDEAIALLLRAQDHLLLTAQGDDDKFNLKKGVISKNLAWAYWAAEDIDLAKEAITDAVSNLKAAGELDEYPEAYCLQALLSPDTKTRDAIKSCEMGMAVQQADSLNIGLLRKARKQNEP